MDQFSGTGTLWLDGMQIQPRLKYRITVTRHGIVKRATGRIVIDERTAGILIRQVGPNSDLVLVFEDGRRWPCTLKNSDGDLLGRGEIA